MCWTTALLLLPRKESNSMYARTHTQLKPAILYCLISKSAAASGFWRGHPKNGKFSIFQYHLDDHAPCGAVVSYRIGSHCRSRTAWEHCYLYEHILNYGYLLRNWATSVGTWWTRATTCQIFLRISSCVVFFFLEWYMYMTLVLCGTCTVDYQADFVILACTVPKWKILLDETEQPSE